MADKRNGDDHLEAAENKNLTSSKSTSKSENENSIEVLSSSDVSSSHSAPHQPVPQSPSQHAASKQPAPQPSQPQALVPQSSPQAPAPKSSTPQPSPLQAPVPQPPAPLPPQSPAPNSPPKSVHKLSSADSKKIVVASVVIFGCVGLALYIKISGGQAQHAFNVNAFGLILAQGIVGTIDFKNKYRWPVIMTAASLGVLWGSTFIF